MKHCASKQATGFTLASGCASIAGRCLTDGRTDTLCGSLGGGRTGGVAIVAADRSSDQTVRACRTLPSRRRRRVQIRFCSESIARRTGHVRCLAVGRRCLTLPGTVTSCLYAWAMRAIAGRRPHGRLISADSYNRRMSRFHISASGSILMEVAILFIQIEQQKCKCVLAQVRKSAVVTTKYVNFWYILG